MSEVKKLSEEDLQAVRSIKREYDNIAFALGDMVIQKSRLLEQQKLLSEKENDLAKVLNAKYGGGNINLETGEITLVQQQSNVKTTGLPNQ